MTEEIVVTKAAEALAEEYGVDIQEVEGSGADGKVLVDDVRSFLSALGGLSENGSSEQPEINEAVYPVMRIAAFSVLERNMVTDLPMHYTNLSEVIREGRYRVVGWDVTTSRDAGENVVRTFLILLARDQ